MTIHSLAADIADRIPEMALDSKLNNAELIERMIKDFMLQDHTRKLLKLQEGLFQQLVINAMNSPYFTLSTPATPEPSDRPEQCQPQ